MEKITDLISALATLLLAASFLFLLIRLPKWLKQFGPKLSAIRRLKLGSVEAELAASSEVNGSIGSLSHAESQSFPALASTPALDAAIEAPQRPDHSSLNERAYSLLLDGNYDEGMAALKEIASSEPQIEEREGLLAFGRYLAFSNGATRALHDLRLSTEQSPQNATLKLWLAKALQHVSLHEEAIHEIEQALQDAGNKDVPSLTIALTDSLYSLDRKDEAIDRLSRATEIISDPADKSSLYAEIAKRLELEANPDRTKVTATLELALRLNPADQNMRFNLAYQYAAHSMPALALYHYRILVAKDGENGTYLNNAGVAAFQVSLPIAGMNYYRTAEERGETLAMSNIAEKMLKVGLFPEAKEILSKARKDEAPHERVSIIEGEAARSRQEEGERLEELVNNSRRLVKWRQRYAEAALQQLEDQSALAGTYQGIPGELTLEVLEKGRIKGTCSFGFGKSLLWGVIDGRAIRFSWETTDSPYFKQAGKGIFVVGENQNLSGYSLKGDSYDASKIEDWKEWSLQKQQ